MILVTGAAGKTGRAVTRALVAVGAQVRALAHRSAQVRLTAELGACDTVVGDMRHRETWTRAMNQVRAVYLICPNMSPDEAEIGKIAIQEAHTAGVEHLVYHSVLHPQTEEMPHHWLKLRVEEQLLRSGIEFTILQPAAYMQNLLGYWDSIVQDGIYPVPYSAETRLSLVDLQDVAEAAAWALTTEGHRGAIYELVGTQPMTQNELAEALGRSLDRPVRAQPVPVKQWEAQGARQWHGRV